MRAWPVETIAQGTSVATLLRRPVVPREHGAWAMLIMPLVVGAGVAGRIGWEVSLLLLAAVLLFGARYALVAALGAPRARSVAGQGPAAGTFWFLLYLAGAAGVGLPLLLAGGRWGLAPLGAGAALLIAVHLWLQERRRERSAPGELLGIAGLSLTAPAAYYAATGQVNATAILLWLLTFLYSGSSVFYVKMKVRQRTLKVLPTTLVEKWKLGRPTILYQVLALVVLGGLILAGVVPAGVAVAFLPLTYKNLSGALRPRVERSVKRLGFIELGHAVLFTALLVAAFHIAVR